LGSSVGGLFLAHSLHRRDDDASRS
jgi:hypothetical protein